MTDMVMVCGGRQAVTLDCSQEAFEGLHRALNATRETSTTVRVPRAALAALLRDHGKLIARLKVEG